MYIHFINKLHFSNKKTRFITPIFWQLLLLLLLEIVFLLQPLWKLNELCDLAFELPSFLFFSSLNRLNCHVLAYSKNFMKTQWNVWPAIRLNRLNCHVLIWSKYLRETSQNHNLNTNMIFIKRTNPDSLIFFPVIAYKVFNKFSFLLF